MMATARRLHAAPPPAHHHTPHALSALMRTAAWLAAFRIHSGMALTLAILGLLYALQALALLRAPAAWLPAAITITLAPGASMVLGQRELAAPHAEREHLSLRRDPTQGWMVSNLSTARQVLVQRGSTEQRIGSTPLSAGNTFQIDAAVFKVSASDARSVRFSHAGKLWRYDGATLYRNGQPLAACPATRLSGKASAWWNRMAPDMLTIVRPLHFGGNLVCGNRLGLAGVAAGAAQLSRHQGSVQLAAGQGDGAHAIVQLNGADLRRQEAPLAGASALIAGHTRFALAATASTLRLTPGRHVSLYYSDHGAPDLPLAAGVQWDWQQRSLWSGGADFSWGLIMFCAACLAVHGAAAAWLTQARASRRLTPVLQTLSGASAWLAPVALLAAGLAVLLAQRAGLTPPAALSMLLGACALLLWLVLQPQPRLTLLSAAAVILLAVGLLTQLELGLGAPQTAWLRYYQKSAALLAIGCGFGALLRLWWRYKQQWQLSQRSIEIMLAVLAAVALAALAAQVLWGDEGGVFDLQPVELAKLALVALSAHCLALRFGWHSKTPHPADHGLRWLRLAAPVLLFLALLGMALVQVDDFSPLILLLVWSGAMLLAYALIARRHLLTACLAAIAVLAVLTVAWLRWSGSEDLVRWGFYADRFLVWLNPAEHPHTGQQLLLGARAVSEGGWLGADHVLGLRSLGQSAGNALLIPAVQDDFAASFFIYRHGLLGALLLWGLQAAFLTGLALAALHAWRASTNARNFRQAWSARYRYFALCGGGAFVFGHLLLSWGTNLAIFPIMGQPMSFLSAGGSHLLFFLCPLLAFSALSAQSTEGE
ncbi:MAG: FtsW/RodA/SpoVE family cell cycle protein [Duganella sp.]